MYIKDPEIIRRAQLLTYYPCGTEFLQKQWDELQNLRKIDARTLSEFDRLKLMEERIKRGDFKLFVNVIAPWFNFCLVHDVIASFFVDLLFLKTNRSLLSLAPRHGKSQLMCFITAYCFALNNGFNEALYATYGRSLTVDFGTKIRDVLDNEAFLSLFPEAALHSRHKGAMNFMTQAGGQFHGTAVGSSVTGKGAGPGMHNDLWPGPLVVDDPVKDMQQALSENSMRTLAQWWSSEMSTRGNKLHFKLITATRYSFQDLHSAILGERDPYTGIYENQMTEENPLGWRYLNIPALCEDEITDPLLRKKNEAAWPEVFDTEYLNVQKKEKGIFTFSALFMGNPVPPEGGMFKVEWLSWCNYDEVPQLSFVYTSLDPAFGVGRDESVFTICGVSRYTDELFILEQCGSSVWEFPDLINVYENIVKKYQSRILVIEGTASGKPLIQHFNRIGKINTRHYPEKGTPLKSKEQKVSQILPAFQDDRVVCVRDDWNHPLYSQIKSFPFAMHDDRVDSLAIAIDFWLMHIRGKDFIIEEETPRKRKTAFEDINDVAAHYRDSFNLTTSYWSEEMLQNNNNTEYLTHDW